MARVKLLGGKKIQVVGDEPDVLDTIEDLLVDCRVEKADSFEEGKQLLEAKCCDLTILDILGLDGYDWASWGWMGTNC